MSEQRDNGSLLSWLNPEISRRKFLKISGALASVATAANFIKPNPAYGLTTGQFPPDPIESSPDVEIKYSTCLMCHGGCGIRCKVVDGVIVKIDGNPYHPCCLEPGERLPYSTPVEDAREIVGAICIKGQAGIQTVYNPYRLLGPIKRAPGTARGAGKWVSITWDQALDEIAAIVAPYRDLSTKIDSTLPELGPIANKVLFMPGRIQPAQNTFTDRFFKNQFGTINSRHDHTSICETSHHVAGHLTTDRAKNHFKPDLLNAQFIMYIGTNPFEAGFPMNPFSRKTVQFKKNGGKLVVVDPRFSKTASKADVWVPIKPGTDAAFALGMIRSIINNSRYDSNYLKNANINAALNGSPKEYTFTDATHLVKIESGRASAYLRASEAGIGGASDYVILDEASGDPAALPDPKSIANPAKRGLLEAPGGLIVINGYTCKTAFTLLKEQANAKTSGEWASICGISSTTIENLANELTNYGKKAVVNPYRGACQHTNGTYTMLCILALNTLMGTMNWKGGNTVGGGHWDDAKGGGKPGAVDVTQVPGGVAATGIQITRVQKKYETDAPSVFARDGYPAQRPWFPFAFNGNFQEVLPSIADQYPYGVDVLFTYWNDVVYTAPAARATFEAILANTTAVPYHIAFSLEPDETSHWADYILPDPSFLERWGTPHIAPTILTKWLTWRQPLVGSVDPVTGDYTPAVGDTMLLEDFFIQ
ncbi:MAG: molybdopterin-dependent oxidoreductase, partial [Candidatus Lindowbacteria bacterium]|nr:molybdopterin-dependent oxidoreductase [Candidatus Lindowbacteria bacterium]